MICLVWRKYRSKYPWITVIQTWRFWLFVVFTIVLLVYAVSSIHSRPIPYFEKEIAEIWVGNIEFDFLTGLYFLKQGKDVYLRGSMPDSQQMNGRPTHCGKYNQSKYLCANWYPKVKLEVENSVEEHGVCQVIAWTTQLEVFQPQTCFSMSDVTWYGGSLMKLQHWPLNKAELSLQPYAFHYTTAKTDDTNTVKNVLDYFWINSAGVAVIVDSSLPFEISMNQSGDKLLCLYSPKSSKPVLKYTICKAQNLRKIQRFVLNKFVHLPKVEPKYDFLNSSAWSTYPLFRDDLDQRKLLKYANDVKEKDFDRSFLDVKDASLALLRKNPFEKNRFLNSHQSLMYVREYGFKLVLPISPLVPVTEEIDASLLVQDPLQKSLTFQYNNMDVNVLDLQNKAAETWLADKMKDLALQYSLDGFHLEGDLGIMGDVFDHIDTNLYTKNFVNIATEVNTQAITSFAVKAQSSLPIIQLTSQLSSWGYAGGLRSVIPSVLNLGILGYPFVIPNTVGGPGKNEVDNDTKEVKVSLPDRELYIRWLGLAVYMPYMMISIPPWHYDEDVVTIAKQFTHTHRQKVAPLIAKAAREFEISGSPIVRPLWWNDPDDRTSQTIDDQFLLGDTMMVAPVVDQGKTQRDIFIPNGSWRNTITNKIITGKFWLKDYHVEIGQVPVFELIKDGRS